MHKVSICFQLSLVALSCLFGSNSQTLAQVTPDSTVDTQVNTEENVTEITGGTTREDNLFHSFQDFSVVRGMKLFLIMLIMLLIFFLASLAEIFLILMV